MTPTEALFGIPAQASIRNSSVDPTRGRERSWDLLRQQRSPSYGSNQQGPRDPNSLRQLFREGDHVVALMPRTLTRPYQSNNTDASAGT